MSNQDVYMHRMVQGGLSHKGSWKGSPKRIVLGWIPKPFRDKELDCVSPTILRILEIFVALLCIKWYLLFKI